MDRTVVVVEDELFFSPRRLDWSRIKGHRTSVASVLTARSCSTRDFVGVFLLVEWSNVKYKSPTWSWLVVDIFSLTACVDCSVKEFQKLSSSSSILIGVLSCVLVFSATTSDGIKISSKLVAFESSFGNGLSLFVSICEEDDDCGGDKYEWFSVIAVERSIVWAVVTNGSDVRGAVMSESDIWEVIVNGCNVWGVVVKISDVWEAVVDGCNMWGVVVKNSEVWEVDLTVERLNHSVRNFPWLFNVVVRLDLSCPSTLINSTSSKWKGIHIKLKKNY